AEEHNAEIIALATLMTTAMPAMREVLEVLEKEAKRGKFKVVVGGGPISPAFAEKIGADVYAVNAAEAARLARELVA
ncbi:MAG: cobalamin-dependent protein, partial [Lachnospiraceae bacterium]